MADIIYRDEKGSDLTAAEVDANNREFEARIAAKPDTVNVRSISSITKTGNTITVHYTDATTDGPFTLPIQKLRWRGEWVDSLTYQPNDLVLVSSHLDTVDIDVPLGVYIVLQNASVASTFDPDREISSDPVYEMFAPFTTVNITPPVITFGAVISASRDMILADANYWFDVSMVGICDITIPSVDIEAWTPGDVLQFEDLDGNQIEFHDDGDSVINPPDGATRKTRAGHSTAQLTYKGNNVWNLSGDLELV